jgi:hypothetical protein
LYVRVQGFYDASLVLVQKSKGVVEPTFGERLMTWSGPLEPAVWGMCVVAALVVGMAYWFLENNEGSPHPSRLPLSAALPFPNHASGHMAPSSFTQMAVTSTATAPRRTALHLSLYRCFYSREAAGPLRALSLAISSLSAGRFLFWS